MESPTKKLLWKCQGLEESIIQSVRVYPRGVDDGKLDHFGRIELRLILVDAWYRSYA